jgi:hypothetical protein
VGETVLLDETVFCRSSSVFLHRLLLKPSDVSKESTASIFRESESDSGEHSLQHPPEFHNASLRRQRVNDFFFL